MDGLQALDLALFVAGTFVAAFVTGLAGFAFAWLPQRCGSISWRPAKPRR